MGTYFANIIKFQGYVCKLLDPQFSDGAEGNGKERPQKTYYINLNSSPNFSSTKTIFLQFHGLGCVLIHQNRRQISANLSVSLSPPTFLAEFFRERERDGEVLGAIGRRREIGV